MSNKKAFYRSKTVFIKQLVALTIALIMLFSFFACTPSGNGSGYSSLGDLIRDKYTPGEQQGTDEKHTVTAESLDLYSESDLWTKLLDAIVEKVPGGIADKLADYGFNEFVKPLVQYLFGLPEEEKPVDPVEQEILEDLEKILNILDTVVKNQEQMISMLTDISKMVECNQLNTVLNTFQQIKTNYAPKTIYQALRREENVQGKASSWHERTFRKAPGRRL